MKSRFLSQPRLRRFKKKGLELSINFIVMLIIAIVVFGMGLVFLGKLRGQASDITAEIDSRQKAQLEQLLQQRGDRIIVPTQTVRLEKGDSHIASVGVMNIFDEEREFNVVVELDAYSKKGATQNQLTGLTANNKVQFGGAVSGADPNVHVLTEKSLPPQEPGTFSFPISARTARAGTYSFLIQVQNGDASGSSPTTEYGQAQQIIVIVS